MAQRGEELLGTTFALAGSARAALSEIEGLRILDGDDPTKLVFALAGTGADGLAVEADLFAQGVRFELANRDTIVALFTIGDTTASAERLVDLLSGAIERHRGEPRGPGAATAVWSVEPEVAHLAARGVLRPRETVAASTADGRIAAEMIVPYPPGIPAIAPGEVVRAPLVNALQEAAAEGTRIAYCADPKLETIQVVARFNVTPRRDTLPRGPPLEHPSLFSVPRKSARVCHKSAGNEPISCRSSAAGKPCYDET